MEYMTMLEEPGMVGGLIELIDDKDPCVVKRTIRVFTNVYRHSLTLLADGTLDPEKYTSSYEEINHVSNKLIGMLQTTENEGIAIHLVRYLEAAIISHIQTDLSKLPRIAAINAPMVRKYSEALINFVNIPYVGAISFCVGIKSLISAACHNVISKEKTINLVECFVNNPPANFFDHNVRSFRKIVQRNLIQLLNYTEEREDFYKILELIKKTGISERKLKDLLRVRHMKNKIQVRKASKFNELTETNSSVKDAYDHLPTCNSRLSAQAVATNQSIIHAEEVSSYLKTENIASVIVPNVTKISTNSQKNDDKHQSDVCGSLQCLNPRTDAIGALSSFVNRCSSKEKFIYKNINLEKTVCLLLDILSETSEDDMKSAPYLYIETTEIMKEKVSVLLALYIPDEFINLLQNEISMNTSSEKNAEKSVILRGVDSSHIFDDSPILLFPNMNTGCTEGTGDIDMRQMLTPRDPRLIKAANLDTIDIRSELDVKKTCIESSILPESSITNSDKVVSENVDPRLRKRYCNEISKSFSCFDFRSNISDYRISNRRKQSVDPSLANISHSRRHRSSRNSKTMSSPQQEISNSYPSKPTRFSSAFSAHQQEISNSHPSKRTRFSSANQQEIGKSRSSKHTRFSSAQFKPAHKEICENSATLQRWKHSSTPSSSIRDPRLKHHK